MAERAPVRIANCSGFYGDRLSAAREMIDGGPIDVLTGDWLAELTMLILARQRMKRGPGSGYAGTFLKQMRDVLADCLERQIKVVTNAGGLDPQGLADALRALATEVGLEPRIGVVTGDDLAPAIDELVGQGESFTNLDTGESFADLGVTALTANAYLGGSGIAAALAAGADLVVCGRVTDAALAIGPAAWWHGWSLHEAKSLDPLAGALVAGHVIECGAQATGGNYAFFAEVPGLEHPGFPIAEVSADGSTVITKHPGTGGLVSTGTVTAQLLYEIGDPLYQNPDVTADFRTLHLEQDDPDRVRISGVRGFPPPERLKVSLNYLGGFRNSMSLVLTGLDIEGKADLALRTICGIGLDQIESEPRELADASSLPVRELSVQLIRGDRPDPRTFAEAQAHLRITVKADQPDAVGRAFTGPAIETALATYPGMFVTAPPAPGTPFGVFWPTTIARKKVKQRVYVEDVGSGTRPIEGVGTAMAAFVDFPPVPTPAPRPSSAGLSRLSGRTELRPLGLIVGARSGDKGGNANIGLWIPDTGAQPDLSYAWLADLFSGPDSVWALIPESRGCPVEIHMLPNLRALNVVVKGLLGRGVNENTLLDPQAKGLGEFLRARTVQIPVEFLAVEAGPA